MSDSGALREARRVFLVDDFHDRKLKLFGEGFYSSPLSFYQNLNTMDLLGDVIGIFLMALGGLLVVILLIGYMILKGGKPPERNPLKGLKYYETDNGGKNKD